MTEKTTVIFTITNAAGLGHITRGLAVARRLQTLNIESVFFTTSVAIELIRKEGFKYFYVPTKSFFPSEVTMNLCVDFVKRQLDEVVRMYKPAGIIYEGVLPSSSMIIELQKYKNIKRIWIKRENYKAGWQSLNTLEQQFDLIVVPKEVGNSYGEVVETDKKKYCNPITLLDANEAYSRKSVRDGLGVKRDERLYYVQLGVGSNIILQNALMYVQQHLLKRRKTKVIIGESLVDIPIGVIDKSIKAISIYPSSRYFRGIDFAIAAAGYNTFHELVQFKVPTLFIPNESTVVDDQVNRARNLEQEHAALRLDTLHNLDSKLDLLEKSQKQIIKKLKTYEVPNGALDAARMIASILGD